MAPSVILYDYETSPYARKVRMILDAAGIPYQRCNQPRVLPRPDLTDLGITYRRIPVLSIGKDVYCDSSLIISTLQDAFPDKALKSSSADAAYDVFGTRTFMDGLYMFPMDKLESNFKKDRESIFPALLRDDLASIKPSALSEFRATMDVVETQFLREGPFIGGKELSVADVHVGWVIGGFLPFTGGEAGFGKEDFPKVHEWLAKLPKADPKEVEEISPDEAAKTILGSDYHTSDVKVESVEPLGMKEGTRVSVETLDDTPGMNPQHGKLVGTSRQDYILELENSIRLHLPKVGCSVKKA